MITSDSFINSDFVIFQFWQFQIKEYVAFVEGTLVDKKDDNSSR